MTLPFSLKDICAAVIRRCRPARPAPTKDGLRPDGVDLGPLRSAPPPTIRFFELASLGEHHQHGAQQAEQGPALPIP